LGRGKQRYAVFKPDLHIVVADPLRPGHELAYYPGETNVRMADVVVINKVDSAVPENVELVKRNVREVNSDAVIIEAASPITPDEPIQIRGKKVSAIEDGPTLTHEGWSTARPTSPPSDSGPRRS